jgi:hypothetical protein
MKLANWRLVFRPGGSEVIPIGSARRHGAATVAPAQANGAVPFARAPVSAPAWARLRPPLEKEPAHDEKQHGTGAKSGSPLPRQMLHTARISLLRSEDQENVLRRVSLTDRDKGQFRGIGLGVREGDAISKGTKDIMLVAIDYRENTVLILDWDGKKITLMPDEPVRIGSGRYRLCLQEIGAAEVEAFDRHPSQTADEKAFMDAHIDAEWKKKYIVF